MKRNLQRLIPKAIQAINEVKISTDKTVSGTYHGFIASFGAGIVQAGILPAVIFFENSERDGTANADKYRITQALYYLMEWENKGKQPEPPQDKHVLSSYIIEQELQYSSRFLDQLSLYAVALKIAMRTFQKSSS